MIAVGAAASQFRGYLAGWVRLTHRFAGWVVALALLTAAAGAYYVASELGFNTRVTDMLSPELPFRRDDADYSRAFPQFVNNMVVVIDGDTPDLADDATRALVAELRQHPDLFASVFDPAGLPFFRRNGLLYLEPDELYELSDQLANAQPLLGDLHLHRNLPTLLDLLGKAMEAKLDPDDDSPVPLAFALDSIAGVAEAQAADRFANLSWYELMNGEPADADARRRIVVLQPALNFASLAPASDAITAVRLIAADLQLDPAHGVQVRLTGAAVLDHEELASVQRGMGLAGALSVTLVLSLLLIGLRSPRLVLATLTTLAVGLVWTAAFATAAIGSLNMISIAFAVLFVGLSVDFGIHYALRFREALDAGVDRGAALEQAAASCGGALTLCAVAAAIGFFSFLPTDYIGLAELGLISGTSMFIALFANLTVLPALIALLGLRPAAAPKTTVARQAWLDRRRGKIVAAVALALGIGAVLLLPLARFDFDPLNLKDPDSESMQTLFDLLDSTAANPYAVVVLADDLAAAQALTPKLEALDVVDEVRTLASYVPADQDEKLGVINQTAFMLGPVYATPEAEPPPSAEALTQAAADFRAILVRYAAETDTPADAAAALRLIAALDRLASADDAWPALQRRLLAGLPARIAALTDSMEAAPVTLDDLPPEIRAREIDASGRARVQAFPKADLRDAAALRDFVAAVRDVAPRATGTPVVILEAGDAVIRAFQQAAAISLVLVLALAAVVLRRLRDVVLVFAPLLLAALLTVAATVVFAIPFNLANVIVLPLMFGLGVAGSIHMVLRARDATAPEDLFATSTPRAVVFSALTTIGSFGSIALSGHPGTASMGLLLTIAITATLVCTLVVLPALMAVWPVRQIDTPCAG